MRSTLTKKWKSIQKINVYPSLDLDVLTEYQLSAEFESCLVWHVHGG